MKLVIFDLDGTLYKTHETIIPSTQRAFDDFGLPIPSKEKILAHVGEAIEDYCEKLAPETNTRQRKNLIDKIHFYEEQLVLEKERLFDGIFGIIESLIAHDYTLAICSNGSQRYIINVLNACGVFDKFKVIKGKDGKKSKVLLIKEIYDELKPEEVVVVGDRLNDIVAAKENNITSIGVTYGYGVNEVQSADFIARNPLEIVGHVSRLSIFNRINSEILQKERNKPIIIGINGVDTSGKTTFASYFETFLKWKGHKTQLIHLDDFHNELKIRKAMENEIDSYIANAFNLEVLTNTILEPASKNETVNCQLNLLDLDSDKFTNKKHFAIDQETIILIEGVLLFRPPIDKYLDIRIFIDISFEEVLKRAEERDVPKYGVSFLDIYKGKYIPVQQKYISTWKPKENSDIVINNNDVFHPHLMNCK